VTGAIGIDLGKSELRGVLLDPAGRVRRRIRRPSPSGRGPEACFRGIRDLVLEIEDHSALAGARVGVATFGVVDPDDGGIRSGGRVPEWTGFPLRERLASALRRPVRVENDAHAAARGEFLRGAARGWSSAVWLTLSTGVALAFVDRSGVRFGAHGLAGQIARARLGPRGATLSRALSGSGLAVRGSKVLGRTVDATAVFALARRGVPGARAVLSEEIENLARTIAWAQITMDPTGFILGGSVARRHPELWPPLRRSLAELLRFYRDVLPRGVRLRGESLDGWAGAVGAALGVSPSVRERRRSAR
jgi:glucokinase